MAIGLIQAHAMVMILAFMFFGSNGILIARYGRSLRLGTRRQFFGKAVWFQIHRFLLSLASLLTLLGFILIFSFAGGQWISPQIADKRVFAHSIIGGIILCCTMIQIWLALYRCAPRSRFRFIFDWSHRIIGLLTFGLSIPCMFLMIFLWPMYHTILVTIISLWTGWIVIVILIFEKLECQQRTTVSLAATNARQGDVNPNLQLDIESGANPNVGKQCYYLIKLLLFFLHIIVSITFSVSLIVFIT